MSTTDNVRYFYKGLEIDDRTREYVEKRLKSIDRLLENVLQTEIEIDLDKKGKFRVEVMIKTPRDLYRAEDITDSVEGSIDMVVDELTDQITHAKDKLRTIKKRGAMSLKKKAVLDENARF